MAGLHGRRIIHRIAFTMASMLVLSSAANSERLPIKTYTTADGLAHNEVNRIVRDSRGFLWFCTQEGLSRFDGYSFTNYGIEQGLPSGYVCVFAVLGVFARNLTSCGYKSECQVSRKDAKNRKDAKVL